MTKFTKGLTKGLLGTVVAGAMALGTTTPAAAADRYDRDRGIDAGDVIAGAVVIGGLAAILSAANRDRGNDRYYDRRYRDRYDSRYDRRYDNGERQARRAIERCVRATEQDARRRGFRYADVTDIRDVDRTRYGWRVRGQMAVEDGRYGYSRYDRYDRRYDRRSRARSYDTGRFDCRVERGRVVDVDYRGIRGL